MSKQTTPALSILSVREEVRRVVWSLNQGHTIDLCAYPKNISLNICIKKYVPNKLRLAIMQVLIGPELILKSSNDIPLNVAKAIVDIANSSPESFEAMMYYARSLYDLKMIPSDQTLLEAHHGFD